MEERSSAAGEETEIEWELEELAEEERKSAFGLTGTVEKESATLKLRNVESHQWLKFERCVRSEANEVSIAAARMLGVENAVAGALLCVEVEAFKKCELLRFGLASHRGLGRGEHRRQ